MAITGRRCTSRNRSSGAAWTKPTGRRSPVRLQEGEQCRQQGQVKRQRQGHADAGNEAELGDARIIGRHEGEEAHRGGECGNRQRPADFGRGTVQRRGDIAGAEALVAVAHAELDAEIDGMTDEEHAEGDRDRVERSDHADGENAADDEADDERGEDGDEDPQRPQLPESATGTTDQPDSAVEKAAPLVSVENWASERATSPVTRTRTPFSGVRPSWRAASRIAAAAAAPG